MAELSEVDRLRKQRNMWRGQAKAYGTEVSNSRTTITVLEARLAKAGTPVELARTIAGLSYADRTLLWEEMARWLCVRCGELGAGRCWGCYDSRPE